MNLAEIVTLSSVSVAVISGILIPVWVIRRQRREQDRAGQVKRAERRLPLCEEAAAQLRRIEGKALELRRGTLTAADLRDLALVEAVDQMARQTERLYPAGDPRALEVERGILLMRGSTTVEALPDMMTQGPGVSDSEFRQQMIESRALSALQVSASSDLITAVRAIRGILDEDLRSTRAQADGEEL